jgi:trehalose 2-sulfotransferase
MSSTVRQHSREEILWLPESIRGLCGAHERELAARFDDLGAGAIDLPDNIRIVLMCFTNRCGSNFFAEVLASHGLLNKAMEFANADYVLAQTEQQGIGSLKDYISWFVRSEAVNGYFAAKIALEQLVMLARHGILGALAHRIEFIMLERGDKLAQAISVEIAEQTGQWAWYDPARKAAEELAFSNRAIESKIEWICASNRDFARFFGYNGIVPDVLFYEDVVTNPQLYADRVAAMLGMARLPVDLAKVELRKQSNETNEAWRIRYLNGRTEPVPSS